MRRLAMLLAVTLPVTLAAQVPDIIPGSRIRLTSTESKVTGTFMARRLDTLDIAESGAVHRNIPASLVQRIDVSRGKTAGAGAMKGMKVGATAGAIVVGLEFLALSGVAEGENPAGIAVAGAVLGAATGAFWGLILGGIIGAESWKTVYSNSPGWKLSVAPTSHERTGLAFSRRF